MVRAMAMGMADNRAGYGASQERSHSSFDDWSPEAWVSEYWAKPERTATEAVAQTF